MVAVSHATGRDLVDLIQQDSLDVTVSVRDATLPSRNVLADSRRDTDGDLKMVLIGAHYDTVIDTEGATDNASGLATVLVLAEHKARRSYTFDVSIILFGADRDKCHCGPDYVAQQEIRDFSALGC